MDKKKPFWIYEGKEFGTVQGEGTVSFISI
jgi:hypothetical protein